MKCIQGKEVSFETQRIFPVVHISSLSTPSSGVEVVQLLVCPPEADVHHEQAVLRCSWFQRCSVLWAATALAELLLFTSVFSLKFISITVKMLLKLHQCEVQVPKGPTLTLGCPPNLPGGEIFLMLRYIISFSEFLFLAQGSVSAAQRNSTDSLPLSFAH